MSYIDEAARLGRQPVTLVEMDLPRCMLTFGISPCTASGTQGNECYNTRATCKAAKSYTEGTFTYRFVQPLAGLPLGVDAFPALTKVSEAPTRLTPGQGLGYRASVTLSLQDFTHHDRHIDPYVANRAYDPNKQGTFFGRLLARNPHWIGRTLRVRRGWITSPWDWAHFRDEIYVIDKIDGPNDKGVVTIACKDVLKRLDDYKLPLPSTTTLATGIDAAATSLTLANFGTTVVPTFESTGAPANVSLFAGAVPTYTSSSAKRDVKLSANAVPAWDSAGVSRPVALVNGEYADGETVRIRIGDELIDGVYSSGGTINSLSRGVGGTAPDAHNAGDHVQKCLRLVGNAVDVLADILVTYGPVASSYIPWADWASERDRWLTWADVDHTLSEPIELKKLVAELCEQFLFDVWWSVETQTLKLKAIAPRGANSQLSSYSDSAQFLRDKLDVKRDLEKQITQVWVWYGLINQAGDDDKTNFSGLYIVADFDAESAYQRSKIKEVKSRWVLNQGQASQLGGRQLARYKDGATVAEFVLDASAAAMVATGDEFLMESRAVQGADGAPASTRMQITEVYESNGKYHYKAQNSAFQGRRYAFIAPNGTSSYAAASDDQRHRYAFIANNDGFLSDGTPGYLVI